MPQEVVKKGMGIGGRLAQGLGKAAGLQQSKGREEGCPGLWDMQAGTSSCARRQLMQPVLFGLASKTQRRSFRVENGELGFPVPIYGGFFLRCRDVCPPGGAPEMHSWPPPSCC